MDPVSGLQIPTAIKTAIITSLLTDASKHNKELQVNTTVLRRRNKENEQQRTLAEPCSKDQQLLLVQIRSSHDIFVGEQRSCTRKYKIALYMQNMSSTRVKIHYKADPESELTLIHA